MGVSRFLKCLSLSTYQVRKASLGRMLSIPKGHFAVYVSKGESEEKTSRFVVPITYLKNPLFQELLRKAEDEFGYEYGMGGVRVPCSECCFLDLIAQLNGSY